MASPKCFSDFDISTVKLSLRKHRKPTRDARQPSTTTGSMKIAIQTPVMTLPWDITPKKMDDVSIEAELSLSFMGMDENDPDNELYQFKTFVENFDEHVKALISATNGAMGKNSEESRLDANFRSTIKESSTGNYPPTIQSKIWLNLKQGGSPASVEDFDMDVMVFDMNGTRIGTDQMQKGCPAAAILMPSYVWCSALGVGGTWVAQQVAMQPQSVSIFGFNLGGKKLAEEQDLDEE